MTKFAAFSLLALAISSAAAAPSPRRWNNERPELTQISHSESSLVDASDLTAVVDILKREPEPTWRHNDYDRRPDVTQVSSSESSLIDLSDLTAVVDVLDTRAPHYGQQAPDVTQVASSKSTLVDASDIDLLVDILSQNNYFVSKRSDEELLARRGNDNSPFWARNTKDERCMCVKRTTCGGNGGGNGGNGGNYNPPHVYKPNPQPSDNHDHGNNWTPKPKPPHSYQPSPVHHSCPTGWSSYSKSSLVDLSGADIVLSILSGNQATQEKTVKAQDATCQDGQRCCWKRGPNTCPSGWSSYSKSTLVDLSDANIVLSILSGNKPTSERTVRAKDATCEAGQNCCWKHSDSCPTGWSSYSESSLVDLSGLDVVLSVLSGNKATEQRTVQAKDARCASGKHCCWQRANKAAACPSGWSSYSKSTLIDLSDITVDLSILSDNGKVTDSRKVKAKDASCGAGQRCCYQKSESKSSLVDASGLNLGVDLLSNNKDSGKGGLLGGNVIPGLLR